MSKSLSAVLWAYAVACAGAAQAQPAPTAEPQPEQTAASADAAAREERAVRLRNGAIVVGGLVGIAAYGRTHWWRDGFTGRFQTENEGWFTQNTTYGGADKLGHGLFGYAASRLLTRAFEAAGNEPTRAVRLGVATAVGALLAVEVVDGYSKEWRFSHEDGVMNLLGGALAYSMETRPALDALIDLRLQYKPSIGPEGRRDFAPVGDYSGQRYLLVFKASGVPRLASHRLWRYLELHVGYAARDFESESRVFATPSRRLSVGIGLNLSELLRRTAYQHHTQPTRTQRLTETLFEYVQMPGTEVHADRVLR